jgi:carboxymethylenebutenolidase
MPTTGSHDRIRVVTGTRVTFPSNGSQCLGYLATPSSPGPGVIVLQEWWGLVPHIIDVCDRLAREGFVALAPDLYGGRTTEEPSEGEKLMMDLRLDAAARDMGGAVDHLLAHPAVQPRRVGAIGFCMGGALVFSLAAHRPIDAAVPFYGLPFQGIDLVRVTASFQGHFAELDEWATPELGDELFGRLRTQGLEAELHVYPGTGHAFFNDSGESYDRDAAALAWGRAIEFLRRTLA